MRSLPAIALALAIVLAGCGSLGPTQETRQPFTVDQTEQPTETTVSTGTAVSTDPSGFDPDPTANDLGDVRDMLSAQQRVLENTSYRAHHVYRATYENGTVFRERRDSGAFTTNESRYYTDFYLDGTAFPRPNDVSVYADGTRAYVRRTSENGTTVMVPRVESTGDPIRPADLGVFRARGEVTSFLFTGFGGMNVTSVTELDRIPAGLEGPLYRVQSRTVDDPQLLAIGSNTTVENASFEAIVDHRGFVYEYSLSFETQTVAGESVRIERRLVYRDLGRTTITQPDWVDEYTAGNATTTTTHPPAQA